MADINRPIQEQYLDDCKVLVAEYPGEKLKADAWNEATGQPGPAGIAGELPESEKVTCVEIDPGILAIARMNLAKILVREKLPKMVQGDIRKLPCSDGQFTSVMDCSAADHVGLDDTMIVLSEYNRVLAKPGNIMVVVWTLPRGVSDACCAKPMVYQEGVQYYFNRIMFRTAFENLFEIRRELVYATDVDGNNLVSFFGHKV